MAKFEVTKEVKSFLLATAKELSAKHKVKIKFSPLTDCYGEHSQQTNTITISSSERPNIIMSALFHELGHHYCCENKIWEDFHDESNSDTLRLKTAYQAELWVDKWAAAEFKKAFPSGYYGKYHKFYGKPGKKESDIKYLAAVFNGR